MNNDVVDNLLKYKIIPRFRVLTLNTLLIPIEADHLLIMTDREIAEKLVSVYTNATTREETSKKLEALKESLRETRDELMRGDPKEWTPAVGICGVHDLLMRVTKPVDESPLH